MNCRFRVPASTSPAPAITIQQCSVDGRELSFRCWRCNVYIICLLIVSLTLSFRSSTVQANISMLFLRPLFSFFHSLLIKMYRLLLISSLFIIIWICLHWVADIISGCIIFFWSPHWTAISNRLYTCTLSSFGCNWALCWAAFLNHMSWFGNDHDMSTPFWFGEYVPACLLFVWLMLQPVYFEPPIFFRAALCSFDCHIGLSVLNCLSSSVLSLLGYNFECCVMLPVLDCIGFAVAECASVFLLFVRLIFQYVLGYLLYTACLLTPSCIYCLRLVLILSIVWAAYFGFHALIYSHEFTSSWMMFFFLLLKVFILELFHICLVAISYYMILIFFILCTSRYSSEAGTFFFRSRVSSCIFLI